IIPEISGKAVVSTDSFVVNPLFFPGGDIGKLSVCGTINDLAMSGARPLYLTAGFILEEGFKLRDLEEIIKSMATEAQEAKVEIVAGDTKIVEKGKGDRIYINTTGIGVIDNLKTAVTRNIQKGDKIIINGNIGEHGLTILKERQGLDFNLALKSDCCALYDLIRNILNNNNGIKFLRDPTRGGIAAVLNEIALRFNLGIEISEEKIPLRQEVKGLCRILGLDPLYLANEGKVILIADGTESERIVETMRRHQYGKQARIIGTITGNEEAQVYMKTRIGGKRVIKWVTGEILPRLC
ncbi:MAG TPA: hydrogenase expression/formation protein HypE, partial [Halanaerobiales bacterium]|nr:hydrogenase expression/formation protein HypE [Halanaerobiales bacterium]